MVEKPMEDTEPRVQRLFHGSYRETGMGPQGLAGAGLSVYMGFHASHYQTQWLMWNTKPNEENKVQQVEIAWWKGVLLLLGQALFALALLFYFVLENSFNIDIPLIVLIIIIGGFFYLQMINRKVKFQKSGRGIFSLKLVHEKKVQDSSTTVRAPKISRRAVLIVLAVVVFGGGALMVWGNYQSSAKIEAACIDAIEYKGAAGFYRIYEDGNSRDFKTHDEAMAYCTRLLGEWEENGELNLESYKLK